MPNIFITFIYKLGLKKVNLFFNSSSGIGLSFSTKYQLNTLCWSDMNQKVALKMINIGVYMIGPSAVYQSFLNIF